MGLSVNQKVSWSEQLHPEVFRSQCFSAAMLFRSYGFPRTSSISRIVKKLLDMHERQPEAHKPSPENHFSVVAQHTISFRCSQVADKERTYLVYTICIDCREKHAVKPTMKRYKWMLSFQGWLAQIDEIDSSPSLVGLRLDRYFPYGSPEAPIFQY